MEIILMIEYISWYGSRAFFVPHEYEVEKKNMCISREVWSVVLK